MKLFVKIFEKDKPLERLSRVVPVEPVVEDNHKIAKVSCERVGKMISDMLQEVNQSKHQNGMFKCAILITPEMEVSGSKIELLFQRIDRNN